MSESHERGIRFAQEGGRKEGRVGEMDDMDMKKEYDYDGDNMTMMTMMMKTMMMIPWSVS